MDKINKIVQEFLDSTPIEERQRIISDIVEETRKKYELRDKAKRKILESDDYILWLCKFTKEHPRFTSDDWLYSPEDITKEDQNNVSALELLFEIISDYAEKNYIPLMPTTWGGYYTIMYNDVYFDIEVASGQGAVFICDRIESSSNQVIDFKLIQTDEELPTTKEIRSKFDKIKEQIKELHKNVSPEIIKKELISFIDNVDLLIP